METAETLIESLQSSNCTFMELKCLNCMIRNSSDKRFKLYLYGIEIDKLCTVPPPHSSFKLYLYGIEIGVLVRCRLRRPVQIVPLWN